MNDRFIALDMFTERIKPEAPSNAPATIRSLLPRTKPIAAAESPAYEFSSEMTVGMSAPPIGMIIITPNASGMPMMKGKRKVLSGCRTSITAIPTAIASNPRFTKFWPLYVIGRCGNTS